MRKRALTSNGHSFGEQTRRPSITTSLSCTWACEIQPQRSKT